MRLITLFVALVATTLALACDNSPTSPSNGSGTLRLMIKDSPYSDAKSLLVTFSEVTAHRSGEGGFTRIPFSEAGATVRTCDLKKLVDAQDVLGVGPLPEGHYTQLRLNVSSAALYFDNAAAGPPCATAVVTPAGRMAPLEIPSGEVRLNREFDVAAAGATTILIDFDGDRSVRETGNGRFMMTPVIGVVSVN